MEDKKLYNAVRKIITLADGRQIEIETGKLAKQADGSVVVKMGDTMLLGTVVAAKDAKPDTDFMPLQVEYKEKYAACGRYPYQHWWKGVSTRDREVVADALRRTHTYELKDRTVASLSGGERQRVWIAMALAQDTKVLFLDEPTTYLDIRYQLQILKLIRQLNREFGITIMMVLHDINQSLYYSDEIVAMKDGRMIAHGLPEEIISGELVQEVYDVNLDIRTVDGKPFVIPV